MFIYPVNNDSVFQVEDGVVKTSCLFGWMLPFLSSVMGLDTQYEDSLGKVFQLYIHVFGKWFEINKTVRAAIV